MRHGVSATGHVESGKVGSVGTNGSRLVTGENFALGRDTNAPG